MENESPTLHDIVREVLTDDYGKLAQERAKRRKSPWNLVLIPLFLGGYMLIAYTLFQIMWRVHLVIYPAHTDRLAEFWGKGISALSFASSFMLLIPLLIAALPTSMLFANAVAWFIPPARRAFNREATGVKWASYRASMSANWTIACVVVPVSLLLSFLGAATLANLR